MTMTVHLTEASCLYGFARVTVSLQSDFSKSTDTVRVDTAKLRRGHWEVRNVPDGNSDAVLYLAPARRLTSCI